MSATLRLEGLSAFADDVTQLPTTLRDESRPVVTNAADTAEATIRAAYPEVTGELKAGLRQETVESATGVQVRLVNDSLHAVWYEYGTELRQTSLGYNRGRMPAAKVFGPAAAQEKRQMVEDVIAVVEAEGLRVRGH